MVTHDEVIRLFPTNIQERIKPVVETGSWAQLAYADGRWSISSVDNVADSSKN